MARKKYAESILVRREYYNKKYKEADRKYKIGSLYADDTNYVINRIERMWIE
jgi:hypothetical protein